MHRLLKLAFAAIAVFIASTPLQAQPGVAHIPLPADLVGTHNGTDYRIRVPENWNGTLLVYAHGTGSAQLEIVPPTFPTSSPTLQEQLLSRGYALAGSFYPSNGNSEKEAVKHTLALTTFFNGAVGKPQRTIVWGASLGGTVALQMAESYPATYDGAIASAPVAGGRARNADFALRYGVAYAAAFGWPTDWWGPLADIRDDLYGNEATLIMPVFQWFNGTNYGQWEFVRLMMQLPQRAWWDFDPSVGVWGYAIDGWKATAVRSNWEQACRGPVAQNIGTVYTLMDDDKAYLSSLGVNADAVLAWMNAHTNITASRSALQCIARDGSPSGKLRLPALTMHGMYDPLVPVFNEAAYRALVDAAQRGNLLLQTYVNGTGHVAFSAEQYLAELNAMEHWLNTGVKPDASFFPESIGFDNRFLPPPWPY